MQVILVLLYLFFNIYSSSDAQAIAIGFCPKLNGMNGFNFTKLQGTWYEVENYWSLLEMPISCGKVNYTDRLDGTIYEDLSFHEKITGRYWKVPTIHRSTSRDGAYITESLISFSPLPFPFWYPMNFVDTDYSTYVIKYFCQQLGIFNMQILWIMGKDRLYPSSVRNVVHAKLAFLGIGMSRLVRSDQTSCLD